MAKITGYKCDGIGCPKTAEAVDVPVGWMTLAVRTAIPGRNESPEAPWSKREDFHLCSNRCLKKLAAERLRAALDIGTEEMTTAERFQARKRRAKEANG